MAETKREEHKRLQRRTDVLKKEHAALARERTPFNKAAHDRHTANLHKHKSDLERHRRRKEDE